MAAGAAPPQRFGWTDEDLLDAEDDDLDSLIAITNGGTKKPHVEPVTQAVGCKACLGRCLLLTLAMVGAFNLGRHTLWLVTAATRSLAPSDTFEATTGEPLRPASSGRTPTTSMPATTSKTDAGTPKNVDAGATVEELFLPRLRLVVNSNVKYSMPLEALLQSLEKVLPKSARHLRELVIVIGGSTSEIGPHTAPGKWGELGVTHINVTQNGYDFNGLSALFRYRNHPRVKARAYLYLHDTVLFTKDFAERFDKLAPAIGMDEVRIPIVPHSNIFVMGHGVVERYKTNFDRNFTKAEGLDIEWNRSRLARDICTFAKNITRLRGRQNKGQADPYHTGFKRDKYLYPDFGFEKFILPFKHGDIGGDGKLRFNDNR